MHYKVRRVCKKKKNNREDKPKKNTCSLQEGSFIMMNRTSACGTKGIRATTSNQYNELKVVFKPHH
jgi:hypothetical protein